MAEDYAESFDGMLHICSSLDSVGKNSLLALSLYLLRFLQNYSSMFPLLDLRLSSNLVHGPFTSSFLDTFVIPVIPFHFCSESWLSCDWKWHSSGTSWDCFPNVFSIVALPDNWGITCRILYLYLLSTELHEKSSCFLNNFFTMCWIHRSCNPAHLLSPGVLRGRRWGSVVQEFSFVTFCFTRNNSGDFHRERSRVYPVAAEKTFYRRMETRRQT